MIQSLTNVPKIKVTLTVPLVSSMLTKGYKVTEIAKHTNQNHSWVSQFISKNYNQIIPLLDTQDVVSAFQAKYLAHKAREKLIDIVEATTDFNKKDLIPLTAVSDRHTQQYRLLSDKSTSNVSIDSVTHNISDLEAREREINERLAKLLPT